jgi:hypothetical protein
LLSVSTGRFYQNAISLGHNGFSAPLPLPCETAFGKPSTMTACCEEIPLRGWACPSGPSIVGGALLSCQRNRGAARYTAWRTRPPSYWPRPRPSCRMGSGYRGWRRIVIWRTRKPKYMRLANLHRSVNLKVFSRYHRRSMRDAACAAPLPLLHIGSLRRKKSDHNEGCGRLWRVGP